MENRSLKKHIFLLFVFVTVSIIIVTGTLSILNMYISKKDLINFNQTLVLKQVNNKVNEVVDDTKDISNYIVENYKTEHRDISMQNLLKLKSFISSILILSKKGEVERYYTKSKHLQNIYKGFDYSNKEYYKKLKFTNVYWSNVFLSSVDEIPTISYSFKMKDKIGVVLIDLSMLSKFVSRFKNQDNSHMVRMFDRNGIVILNPDYKSLISQRYNAKAAEVFTKLINIKSPNSNAIFKANANDKMQYGTYWQNSRTGWYILVRNDYSVMMKPIYYMVFLYIFLIIVFIGFTLFLSLKISKRIFHSFDKFHLISSKIAKGNYSFKHQDLHFEEFNSLLISFNKMQEEIDKREDSLEKSLESFKALFNSTMEAIVLSHNFKIIDLNDVSIKLFGFEDKKSALGRGVFDFISDDFKDLVKDRFSRNILEPYEIEFIKDDGTIMNALVQGKFLEYEGRQVRVSAIIDITDMKNKDRLLFQQTKMASMGEMIGNIAHQWRQPLNVISTSASSIKLEKEFGILEESQIDSSMDTIVQNALYLSKTIDDFRNFFRTERSMEKFSVQDAVNRALKLLQASIKNHDIIIITDFLEIEHEIDGYPNEFIQVIINIINNSKDAFVEKQIHPRVIKIKESITKDRYKLKFTDNAGGIPDNIIFKIFDPYFTTKHKSQGTGIGLYMSHQIITDHFSGELYAKNSNLKLEDTFYKGCSFTIKLPRDLNHNYTFNI